MALGHDGLLHQMLGLLANLFPNCLAAQRAFCSGPSPALLQRCLDLVCKPNLDLPTLEVRHLCCHWSTHRYLQVGSRSNMTQGAVALHCNNECSMKQMNSMFVSLSLPSQTRTSVVTTDFQHQCGASFGPVAEGFVVETPCYWVCCDQA